MAGVSNGLGTAGVGGANYGVNGAVTTVVTVVNQASPVVQSAVDLGSVRVGGSFTAQGVSVTNMATTAPQAALDASISGSAPVTTNGGTISLLGPGAPANTTALQVNLTGTGTAGHLSGTATVGLVSDAANIGNCSPNCTMTLASQTVAVSGNVYAIAQAVVNTPQPINLGIVHVGSSPAPSQALSITNGASGTLTDSLVMSAGAATGPFTASGNLAPLAAGGTDTSSLHVGMSTAAAGVFSGTASFTTISHDSALADLALANTTVAVTGQVNNYASPVFELSGAGGLSHTGSAFTLNLGNISQGASPLSSLLSVLNNVAGPSDFARGTFVLLGSEPTGLSITGINNSACQSGGTAQAFCDLGAGGVASAFTVGFSASAFGQLGGFTDQVELLAEGYNSSGYVEQLPINLTIEGNVVTSTNVPEPDSLSLMLLGSGVLVGSSMLRRRRAQQGKDKC